MSSEGSDKKKAYLEKFVKTFQSHSRVIIAGVDNIGSHHMQNIRKALRGKAIILMGKNTMMRLAIRQNLEANPEWGGLLKNIVGNVGLVFTNCEYKEVRDLLTEQKKTAPAKAGIVAPQDVIIPKGETTLPPTKTSFLQALSIASKIKGQAIEITQDVHLIKAGEKVGSSEAQLLQMLDIRPFKYGMEVISVYEGGFVMDAKTAETGDDDIVNLFSQGVSDVAALSLALNIPTLAAVPHIIAKAYENVLAFALGGDYTYSQVEKLKALLSDPEAMKAAAAAAAAAASGSSAAPSGGAAEEKKEEKKEEKPESEDMGFDLFG